jgi:hypothetical protein
VNNQLLEVEAQQHQAEVTAIAERSMTEQAQAQAQEVAISLLQEENTTLLTRLHEANQATTNAKSDLSTTQIKVH